jgi:diguanylate cyclase (GGDEF)-like protein/PAS domain S-box-containing protein
MIFFATCYVLSAIFYLYIGIVTIIHDQKNDANRIYLVVCLIMFSWAALSSMVSMSKSAAEATMFRRYATFSWSILYAVLLHFYSTLTGKTKYFKNPVTLLIIYCPMIYSIYLYFFTQPESVNAVMHTNLGWIYTSTLNQGFVWDYFLTFYYLSYLMISIYLLWRWGKESGFKREKRQARILISTLSITIVLGSVTDIVLPKLNLILLPPTAVLLCLIPIGAIWYSMGKYKLMNLSYESLTKEIFKLIDDGIVIVDKKGFIVDINQGALHMIGYPDKRQLIGKEVGDLFIGKIDLSQETRSSQKEAELKNTQGITIPVLFQHLTLIDQMEDVLGSLVSFQDISDIKKVQRDLQESKDNLEYLVEQRTLELSMTNTNLKNEIEARKIVEDKVTRMAFLDTLTQLPNRRLFDDRLRQSILKADREQKEIGLMYLDIDNFKQINDNLGHVKGDRLLVEIANRLRKNLRKVDTIARVGGDEFLIIVDGIKDINHVKRIAEKLMMCFGLPFQLGQKMVNITTSIGISIYPQDGPDFETLIKNADAAMYRAKETGKNRYEFCTLLLKDYLSQKVKLTEDLKNAIEKNELELYYQPQVKSSIRKVTGVEALLRWNHPELGMIGPSVFIPIAESSGLIIKIGEWVLNAACRQNKSWQDAGLESIPISVNVSVKQFRNGHIIKNVRDILKETGLDPQYLELEITESIVVEDVENITRMLVDLKDMGIKLAIDDFGTEYASLNYLKQLPIDRIKIAMTFVRGIGSNPKDEIITKTIIYLAQSMDMKVIAEGVETVEQLDFLQRANCDDIQGYYFFRPMRLMKFENLLRKDLVVRDDRGSEYSQD